MPNEQDMIVIENRAVAVAWRRHGRATRLSLRIDPVKDGVILTLPPRVTLKAGLLFLNTHAAWIAERLRRLPPADRLHDGAALMLDGQPHRICHRQAARRGTWIDGAEICVSGDAAFLPRRIIEFLRLEAVRRLGAQVADKAGRAAVTPHRIVCKDTSSRWGSCTAGGVLMFSWRLVMAPLFVQDYVVAHEVAHLRHMNHGAPFWALVQQLTPHTQEASGWLKLHGPALMRVYRGDTA